MINYREINQKYKKKILVQDYLGTPLQNRSWYIFQTIPPTWTVNLSKHQYQPLFSTRLYRKKVDIVLHFNTLPCCSVQIPIRDWGRRGIKAADWFARGWYKHLSYRPRYSTPQSNTLPEVQKRTNVPTMLVLKNPIAGKIFAKFYAVLSGKLVMLWFRAFWPTLLAILCFYVGFFQFYVTLRPCLHFFWSFGPFTQFCQE